MVKSVIRSAIIVIAASQVLLPISVGAEQGGSIVGPPKVIEGDLLKVGNTVVRLYGIDAPERDQTCRGESREYDCGYIAATGLMDLTAGLSSITCRIEGRTADGTTVASCSDPHGFDLSQQMIHTGWALALPGAESSQPHRGWRGFARYFTQGCLNALLSPKSVMFYIVLFPQFLDPGRGDILVQSLFLVSVINVINFSVIAGLCLFAGGAKRWFRSHPRFLIWQRRFVAAVFPSLAVRVFLDRPSTAAE